MRRPASYTLALLAAAGGCRDNADSPTAPRPESLAAATATAPAFLQLSAGGGYTCGVSTDNEAYCWGQDSKEQLGNGTETGGGAVPSLVLGGFRFRQISAGTYHTCGMTVDDEPYCWGFNGSGQLGTGIRRSSSTPVFGDFGRFFSEVSVGQGHTCGVQDPVLMCWGSNAYGQLGTSDRTRRLAPEQIFTVPFSAFRQVSAGAFYTCAVTTDDRAYCWGHNYRGVLGIDDFRSRRLPTLVVGGLKFRQVAAGVWHTCGVTTDNLAYCWGWNNYGQLGNGTGIRTRVPSAVVGGLQFKEVTVGTEHTCGVTLGDQAFCWGRNNFGQLGIGRRADRNRPVAVAGGIEFTAVTAGSSDANSRHGFHTCGLTSANVAYCWGANHFGQLGNPVEGFSNVPVPVGGPM